ncbi:glucosamine-6-phosphate isomerases/6-phosphogluconolactonase-domain-containing protein [Pavlovales sp. CCMP2436]|nr:glucosamine-6-phosphate isomerases/6-phosphogluconolactonase-domain-containing protein [Pavlovales sp. CCMP2436]
MAATLLTRVIALLACAAGASAAALARPAPARAGSSAFGAARGASAVTMADASILPVDPLRVVIKSSPEAVAYDMSERLYAAAMSAIADRGHFVLAIPGGSILKMLNNTKPAWASRATVVYVNHKCVDMADEEQSTHAKAQKIFMSNWVNVTTIVLGGSGDAKAEATAYEAQIRALPETTLPRDAMGKPVFDMMLIGVGDDGHVGSLYPGREEVGMTEGWVLPVEMKSPGSITLSLPLMASAKSVIIAACGV